MEKQVQDREEYITLTQAAHYLGVSRLMVWSLLKQGRVRSTRSMADPNQRLVRRQDLEALKEREPTEGVGEQGTAE